MGLKSFLLEKQVSPIAAKYLIQNGKVKLNGKVTTDPDFPAYGDDRVEIDDPFCKEDSDFWSFRLKDERHGIVEKGDMVVFFGSPVEGVVKYFKSRGADIWIVGAGPQDYRKITENPLRTSADRIIDKIRIRADTVFFDLGVDAIKTMESVQNNFSVCKEGGKILVRIPVKERSASDVENMGREFFSGLGMKIREVFNDKTSVTVFGQR